MEKCVQLSGRLKLIASFVEEGKRLADIGTDHGYIPIYLVCNGVVPSAVAMDINAGPLKRAEENIRLYGAEGKISLKLSDGMDGLSPGEVDSAILAGMGGRLIIRILENGRDVCSRIDEIILSPHSEVELVRKYLMDNGFAVVREEMVFDEGKYYTVMKAVHGHMEYGGEEELLYGRLLLEKNDVVLKEYLLREKAKYNDILDKLPKDSENPVKHKLQAIEKALGRYKDI